MFNHVKIVELRDPVIAEEMNGFWIALFDAAGENYDGCGAYETVEQACRVFNSYFDEADKIYLNSQPVVSWPYPDLVRRLPDWLPCSSDSLLWRDAPYNYAIGQKEWIVYDTKTYAIVWRAPVWGSSSHPNSVCSRLNKGP